MESGELPVVITGGITRRVLRISADSWDTQEEPNTQHPEGLVLYRRGIDCVKVERPLYGTVHSNEESWMGVHIILIKEWPVLQPRETEDGVRGSTGNVPRHVVEGYREEPDHVTIQPQPMVASLVSGDLPPPGDVIGTVVQVQR